MNEDFDLGAGDAFEISDDEQGPREEDAAKQSKKKKQAQGLPMTIENEADLKLQISKYKKALLNKRGLLKDAKQRLEEEGCQAHLRLGLLMCAVLGFALLCEKTLLQEQWCDQERLERVRKDFGITGCKQFHTNSRTMHN